MIGLELAHYTVLAGTTKTQLNGGSDVILPAWARSIVAIEVNTVLEVPVTAEDGILSAVYLESDDFNVAPFEVLAAPIGGVVTEGGPSASRKETYAVNAAVNGGDRLRVYGKNFVTVTNDPEMAVSIILSSEPPAYTQKHAKLGSLTTVGTAIDTDVAGTVYTFTAGHRITELFAVVAPTTVTTIQAIAGYIRYESSEFGAPVPLKLLLNPVQAIITTGSVDLGGVSRQTVDVPVRSPTTIQDYINVAIESSGDGSFITGVIFE